MHNSLFDMADGVGLHPVIGLPRDFLHLIVLGLFGYLIVKAIFYLLSQTVVALDCSGALWVSYCESHYLFVVADRSGTCLFN